MKGNAISIGIGIWGLILTSAVSPCSADRINPRTIIEGTIKNVDHDSIVIDSAVKEQGDVRLQIDNDTLFKQAESVGDLEEGDAVMVSFKEEGNEKVAVYVAEVYPVSNYAPEGDYLERKSATISAGSMPVDEGDGTETNFEF